MIRLKNLFFVTLFLLVIQISLGQRNYDNYNRLGLNGGFAITDISTSDLTTESGGGFIAGFTTRGSFRNNFDLIYGISFASEQIKVFARGVSPANGINEQFLEYTISGAQLNFLGSYNIVKHHVSLEFGPILQVNGKMKLQQEQFGEYIIDGYTTIRAEDIQDISKIGLRAAGGITAGLESFRISAQYQYGVTNTLNNLNDQNLENSNFEGHTSTILIAAIVYF
ncbi:hypothetical protein ACFQO1_00575 [Jejudonia soesokkakensis]|uniref:Outer membrane protein beta-barrel domain-containing protein n=1 Tax=Jejudonia soesokkakensis TaxID=1323432 RepID=A0ABW2MTP1_9FLAO